MQIRRVAFLLLAAALTATGCGKATTNSPTEADDPGVRAPGVTVSGPLTVGAGGAQYTATYVASDGTTQDVTNTAQWSVSPIPTAQGARSNVTISNSGRLTGSGAGEVEVIANYQGALGNAIVTIGQ